LNDPIARLAELRHCSGSELDEVATFRCVALTGPEAETWISNDGPVLVTGAFPDVFGAQKAVQKAEPFFDAVSLGR